MICKLCKKREAEIILPYARLALCPECFRNFFIRRVKRTVEEFKMFRPGELVGVAVSGGKDSAALLHALRIGFPQQPIVAIHINLGIKGYSSDCERKVERQAEIAGVKLLVYDLEAEEGYTIDSFSKTRWRRRMCAVCGTIKRHVLNMVAHREGVKALATGHNLEDTLEVMYKLFLSGDFKQLARLYPTLPSTHPKLVSRIKPLVRTPEHEALLYTGYSEIPVREASCPYSNKPIVDRVKRWLDEEEHKSPGFKYRLLSSFLKLTRIIRASLEEKGPRLNLCRVCGYPTSGEVCAKCRVASLVSPGFRV